MTIYAKLLAAKKHIKTIVKNRTAKGTKFSYNYADINDLLDEVLPALESNGLVLIQPIEDGKVYSRVFDAESGEQISSWLTLPINLTPQDLGSAITYFRRYTLQSLLALSAEDDDGHATHRAALGLPNQSVAIKAQTAHINPDDQSMDFRFPFDPYKGHSALTISSADLTKLAAYLDKQISNPKVADYKEKNQLMLEKTMHILEKRRSAQDDEMPPDHKN